MKETGQIRKAEKKDIDAVAAIYAHIHEQGAADGHEREKCGGAPIISKAGLCRTGYRALHI